MFELPLTEVPFSGDIECNPSMPEGYEPKVRALIMAGWSFHCEDLSPLPVFILSADDNNGITRTEQPAQPGTEYISLRFLIDDTYALLDHEVPGHMPHHVENVAPAYETPFTPFDTEARD